MARDNLRTEQDFLNLMSTWNVRERIEAGYEEGGFVMTVNYALIKINK